MYMRKCLLGFDVTDCLLRYSEAATDFSLGIGRQENFHRLTVRDLCVMAQFASLFWLSSLCTHIREIFGARSEKEVIRINAGRNIAAMADKQSVWDWAIFDYPCFAVSFSRYASIAEAAVTDSERASPKNAAIWLWRRMKGQLFRDSYLARRKTVFTFGFSQDRLHRAIEVRAGVRVRSAARLANYSSALCVC